MQLFTVVDTQEMMSTTQWLRAIDHACAEPNAAHSNRLITELHYALSEALCEMLGREGGPNFHTWAVWGSRKAGSTIRQEDLDSAIRNATATAAVVGSLVGAATGFVAGRRLHFRPDSLTALIGAGIGTVAGGWAGREIAIWSRRRAAELILAGNRTVLKDIGTQTVRFLELLRGSTSLKGRAAFFSGLRRGPTEEFGQDRLATAFRHYLQAFEEGDLNVKRLAMIAGNCEIVFHEHIRLEPYIRRAMPLIIRHCATQRMMTYEVGEKTLSVGKDIPGVSRKTAARDWTRIEDRMRYVFALFREFHDSPEVFCAPYNKMLCEIRQDPNFQE